MLEKNIQRKKEKAFSLLEVMVALTFLAVGIIALVSSLGTSGDLLFTTEKIADGNKAARIVMETLRGYKSFQNLYTKYNAYKYVNNATTGPFFVMADGSINWAKTNTVASPPTGAIGYGFLDFVTNESTGYKSKEWGTETVWTTSGGADTDGDGVKDSIDLDGDGLSNRTAVTVGRTSSTPVGLYGYYTFMPVKVTVRMFHNVGTSSATYVEVVKRGWISNNYEK